MFCNLPPSSGLQQIIDFLTCTINRTIIPLLFTLAIVGFVYGVVQYFIIGAAEEAKREQGRQFIIWGIVAFTVLVSIWGIVRIVGDTFDLNTSVLPGTKPSGSDLRQNNSNLRNNKQFVDPPLVNPCGLYGCVGGDDTAI